jgi:hypothetical protein
LSISLQFNQHNKQNNDTEGSHVFNSTFEIITGRATPVPKPIPTNNSLQLFFSFMLAMFACTNKRYIQIKPTNIIPPKIKDFESEKHKHIEVVNVKVISAIVVF